MANSPLSAFLDNNLVQNNFRKDTRLIAKLCLETFQHLVTWIPLNQVLQPVTFDLVFRYIKLNDSNSILSLSLLNEVMEKNYLPSSYSDFLLMIFKNIFSILHVVTLSPSDGDEEFLGKLTRFTYLFVSNHFRRVEEKSTFPIMEFLSLLFKFTFIQSNVEIYLANLEIWEVLLDYFLSKKEGRNTQDFDVARQRYFECLMSLQQELVKKTCFSTNTNEMTQLDDSDPLLHLHNQAHNLHDVEEENQSDVERYVSGAINLIYRISQMYPNQVLEFMFPKFAETTEKFCKLDSLLKSGAVSQQSSTEALIVVKDLTFYLRIFNQLSHHFVEDYETKFSPCNMLVNYLLNILGYIYTSKIYEVYGVPSANSLGAHMMILHVQAFGAVKSFLEWIAQYDSRLQAAQALGSTSDLATLLGKIVDLVLVNFTIQINPEIQYSAAELLKALTAANLITLKTGPGNLPEKIFNSIGFVGKMSTDVQAKVFVSVGNILISVQDKEKFNQLIQHCTKSFVDITNSPSFSNICNQPDVMKQLADTMLITSEIVSSFKSFNKQVKSIIFESLQNIFQSSLKLLQIYFNNPAMLKEALNFIHKFVECLRAQAAVYLIEQSFPVFLNFLNNVGLGQFIQRKDESEITVLIKIFDIIQMLTEDSSNKIEGFLPNVVNLSLTVLLPIIVADERLSSSLLPCLYKLHHSLILHHWKYFHDRNPMQLEALLLTFVQGLARSDFIDLYRLDLELLQSLNSKQNLYSKQIFGQKIFFQMMKNLIFVLVSKSHNLLREEIMKTIYTVILAVGWPLFYGEFLPVFLDQFAMLSREQKNHLLTVLKTDLDFPSFSVAVNQFANDWSVFAKMTSLNAPLFS
eukprot:TRINITY_DN2055_c0_g1_i1.p1 TRINITY_DN2055_c0_g1~~TRINITY_DN2055_c0_g1_i1.p1  ORF type:complete len:858 (-),score=195.95 TRINITY_DN2055_c0_g1_i1:1516-4089(-)